MASCRDSWAAYGIEDHRGCDLAMTKPRNGVFTRFSGKKHKYAVNLKLIDGGLICLFSGQGHSM